MVNKNKILQAKSKQLKMIKTCWWLKSLAVIQQVRVKMVNGLLNPIMWLSSSLQTIPVRCLRNWTWRKSTYSIMITLGWWLVCMNDWEISTIHMSLNSWMKIREKKVELNLKHKGWYCLVKMRTYPKCLNNLDLLLMMKRLKRKSSLGRVWVNQWKGMQV